MLLINGASRKHKSIISIITSEATVKSSSCEWKHSTKSRIVDPVERRKPNFENAEPSRKSMEIPPKNDEPHKPDDNVKAVGPVVNRKVIGKRCIHVPINSIIVCQ
jgi:hypothetical protein